MPINIRIDAEQFKEGIKDLNNYSERLLKTSNDLSNALVTLIKNNHIGGSATTDTSVRRRTGDLSRRMAIIKPEITASELIFGAQNPLPYARVHIAPRGTITVIKPRNARKLAIPLPAVQTRAGVTRGKPRDFQNTFIRKSKAGNLIIFENIGRGQIRPLFVLKDEVRVPARVHTDIILEKFRPKVINELREAILNA